METLYDEGDIMTLFSRGHHDDARFTAALSQEYGYTDGSYPDGLIYRAWWRFVPRYADIETGCYIDAAPHSRGAFPVTAVDL